MSKAPKSSKMPMSPEQIFKITMYLTFAVATLFLVRNLSGGNFTSAAIIAGCMAVFAGVVFLLKRLNASQKALQMALCVLLVLLVFIISANSGAFYSDDFPLFLALIGLTGLYLEPACTIIQTVAITIALIVLYIIHPEKADPFSQYFMCLFLFDLAAFINLMLIRRGRAFIEIANQRAKEAEQLLSSIQTMGNELERSFIASSQRVDALHQIDLRLDENTSHLQQGSESVHVEAHQVAVTCSQVQEQMRTVEQNIEALNREVRRVEDTLEQNKHQMKEMNLQMQSVNDTVNATNQVFSMLQEQIHKISSLSGQLSSIAFNTNILALNASIEAARAGEAGKGFAVVADEVQSLAANSNDCSKQVIAVVTGMTEQITLSAAQLSECSQAIQTSLSTLSGLENGFTGLITQFESLYGNIDEQNQNIIRVDSVFGDLKLKVDDMSACSEENQVAVGSIVDAMSAYRSHINLIMDDTKEIHDLSSSMLESSNSTEE